MKTQLNMRIGCKYKQLVYKYNRQLKNISDLLKIIYVWHINCMLYNTNHNTILKIKSLAFLVEDFYFYTKRLTVFPYMATD